jgi:hypothetical protein
VAGELPRQECGRLLHHHLRVHVACAPKAGAHVRQVRARLCWPLHQDTLTASDTAATGAAARLPVGPGCVETGRSLILLLHGGWLIHGDSVVARGAAIVVLLVAVLGVAVLQRWVSPLASAVPIRLFAAGGGEPLPRSYCGPECCSCRSSSSSSCCCCGGGGRGGGSGCGCGCSSGCGCPLVEPEPESLFLDAAEESVPCRGGSHHVPPPAGANRFQAAT